MLKLSSRDVFAIEFEDYMLRKMRGLPVSDSDENDLRGNLNMNPQGYTPEIKQVENTIPRHEYVHKSMMRSLMRKMIDDMRLMPIGYRYYDNPRGFEGGRPKDITDNEYSRILQDKSQHIFDYHRDPEGMIWMQHHDRQNDLSGLIGPFANKDVAKTHMHKLIYDNKNQSYKE